MSLNFWRKLRKLVQKREREAFLERHCVNLKCPHCNTWMSDADSAGSFSAGHSIATNWTCGQCGKVSAWVCEAGFWFPAEKFGIGTEQQEPRHD